MPEPESVALTIFLIKEEVADHDLILPLRDDYKHFAIPKKKEGKNTGDYVGILYVRRSRIKRPPWLAFFQDVVDPKKVPAKSASSAAVLLVHTDKRIYALTFGYGRGMLADGVLEERFGLRATLNAINPTKIRSIDKKIFEAISRHTREQASRDTGIEAFGLNVEQDLLRAVTGTPTDPSLGSRLTGMDALTATVRTTIQQLPKLLERYGKLSQEKKYQEHFAWIDNIAEVTDPGLLQSLDDGLVRNLKKKLTDKIWLAVPEILDWSDVGGFKYRQAKYAGIFPDLDLEQYFSDFRAPKEVSMQRLNDDRVRCMDLAKENEKRSWSVYKCLSAELQLKGETYVLSEGHWYRVDTSFAKQINHSVASLPATSISLPSYGDASEAHYNQRAATQSGGQLALMDKKMIPFGPSRGVIEFCDLYSQNRILLHVKRYGASSVLSHLFSQGAVAARALLSDPAFRTEVNERLPPTHRFGDSVKASDFEVAFAIIEQPGKDLNLPFFSKANLKNTCDLLRTFGFKTTLTAIPSGS